MPTSTAGSSTPALRIRLYTRSADQYSVIRSRLVSCGRAGTPPPAARVAFARRLCARLPFLSSSQAPFSGGLHVRTHLRAAGSAAATLTHCSCSSPNPRASSHARRVGVAAPRARCHFGEPIFDFIRVLFPVCKDPLYHNIPGSATTVRVPSFSSLSGIELQVQRKFCA